VRTRERLLERDDALGRLAEAVARASEGVGRVVVVAGEAGVGKTTLVRRFVDEAGGELRVLWGGCDDLTVPEPLAPLRDIAEQAGEPLAAALTGGDPREIGRALREELARVTATICVVEDCHWADEATLDVLAHVARRISGLGSVLAVTFRDDELGLDHRLRAVVGSIPSDDVVRVPLEPLSSAAVAELAGADVDGEALFAATGGNPFLVTEALAAGEGGRAPASVRDAVLARAARLSRAARAVLEVVSVVPARAELWLVEAQVAEADAAIAECERSGLLVLDGEVAGFRHELARRAYRESLSPLRRLELNRGVLAILEERGVDPARLVHHAEAAQDQEALTRYALLAARRAVAARSHREAVALFERALRHGEVLAPDERAAAYEGLSTEAYTEGRADLALRARRSAVALRRELGDARAAGANLRWLSRLHWWHGQRREAEEAAAEAVAALEPLGPSRELAMAYSNRSQLLMLAQLSRRAIEVGERAMELARELGDTETLVHAQTNVGTARMIEDPDGGRALLLEAGQLALDNDLDEHACRAFHNVASMDHDLRRFELAGPEIDRALAVAGQVEQSWFEADTTVLRALLDVSLGRWQEAVSAIEELLDTGELPAVSEAPATWALAAVELRRGGSQAHQLVNRAWELAAPTEELQWVRPAACLRAEAAWLVGDHSDIDAATDPLYATALERGHGWDVGELAIWRWRGGVLDEAPPRCAAPYALSIAGDWEAAARAWEQVGAPYERALALCDAPDPVPVLAGVEVLDGLGASAPARLVRRKLQALGVRNVPRGPRASTRAHPAGLSARQAEVLELVAAGQSNAQIAGTLFLTPKTVEHHVTAILRKLRVDSRAAAVAAARAQGALGSEEEGGAVPS
jgi:DNA-binding CsgD family transcriptional regulator/tetratricopeptide (TPR) repeat protein/ribosomal protein L10